MSEPDHGLTRRAFRIRWVLASAAGMAVAGAVARPLSYLVGGAAHEAFGGVVGEAVVGAVAGGGVLGGIALAQWLLLRQRVSWAARWPAALAAAGAAAAATGFAADEALGLAGYPEPPAVPAVVGLTAFVLAHWLVLRRCAPGAGLLAAASAGGFVLAAVVTVAVGTASGFEGESPLFGALFGAVYGWITVLALGRTVRTTS